MPVPTQLGCSKWPCSLAGSLAMLTTGQPRVQWYVQPPLLFVCTIYLTRTSDKEGITHEYAIPAPAVNMHMDQH